MTGEIYETCCERMSWLSSRHVYISAYDGKVYNVEKGKETHEIEGLAFERCPYCGAKLKLELKL